MGLIFIGALARQRSLASAALLFLVLVDEIEGLVFLAVGVIAQRTDLFLAAQDVLFPTVVMVAGVVSLARNWRRRAEPAALEPIEMMDNAALASRIGGMRPQTFTTTSGAAISLYAQSHGRTSRPG
ncbi:MAG TPA: hypothetical protein VGK15_08200 [Candidatus Limnocylindria bacterium]